MNRGQHRFHDYILERVREDRVEEAKVLLTESFRKQDEKTFDQKYLQQHFTPEITAMLQPAHVEEVNRLMHDFGAKYRG